MSHNAPYRHFDDKTDLLAAVAEEGFWALTEALKITLASAPEHSLCRLEAIGVCYVQYAVDHAAHYRVVFGPYQCDKGNYPSLRRAAKDSFAVLESVIAAGQAQGAIRSGDSAELARAAWALVHGLSMLLIDGQLGRSPQISVQTVAEQTTRLLSEGLAVRRDEPK